MFNMQPLEVGVDRPQPGVNGDGFDAPFPQFCYPFVDGGLGVQSAREGLERIPISQEGLRAVIP